VQFASGEPSRGLAQPLRVDDRRLFEIWCALGIRVTDGSQLDDTLDSAAARDVPALIEIVTDP